MECENESAIFYAAEGDPEERNSQSVLKASSLRKGLMARPRVIKRLLVDGHVHFHENYDEAAFLERHTEPYRGTAQSSRHCCWQDARTAGVRKMAKRECRLAGYVTREPSSLVLGGRLLVIAGRQIVTAERIEVLAVGWRETIENGLALDATIAAIQDEGAVPVLPGRWQVVGPRGRLVANAAARYNFLLGDNAGWPFGLPRSALFQQYAVLPGTDPLRLKTEQERVGTYGFVLEGHFDSDRPAAGIVKALQNLTQSPPVFGNRVGPYGFLQQHWDLVFTMTVFHAILMPRYGRRYDLIVVGGGIYGMCLALEASRRDLRPLLLERDDFGGATSLNSLRILHGGLRYLQTLVIPRFFESVEQRAWFMANFRPLCRVLPCLMPLYGKGLRRPRGLSRRNSGSCFLTRCRLFR